MPLNVSTLQSDLQAVAANPPATSALCAAGWATAMQHFATAVVPASTSVSAAKTALQTALATAFASPAAAPGMATAFTAFAAAVGGGMVGFVPTPPATPPNFAALFAGPKPATHALAASAIAGIINTWMKTGSSTPVAGGAPIPWS